MIAVGMGVGERAWVGLGFTNDGLYEMHGVICDNDNKRIAS